MSSSQSLPFLIALCPSSVLSELMLPDGAHLRSEDWTIFCLNQTIPDVDDDAPSKTDKREKPLLYVLNLVRTKHDATARRWGIKNVYDGIC